MKFKTLILIGFVTLFSVSSCAKGKEENGLKWYSFDEGLKMSVTLKKKIIMDVYTDWCGWCKQMDKTTYSNSGVISYLNEKYIPVKLNAESNKKITYQGKEYTEQQLSHAIGVSGYPATAFFDGDANLITIVPGYIESADFLNIIMFLGDDIYKTKSYEDYIKSVSK